MRSTNSLLGLLLLLTLASTTDAEEQARNLVTFYAMGDVPYAPAEDATLPQQIDDLPDDAEFVIHVGDIKTGATACDENVYQKVSGMLSKSAPPVFIIPGDNEWNDCTDPTQAWQYWNQYFMRFDQRWHHRLPVFRQLEQEENFSFVKNNVLFVGINLVGGRVHDKIEWKKRHAHNLDWVRRHLSQHEDKISSLVIFGHAHPNAKHDDFFKLFKKNAELFDKPILYLHGDGHRWIYDRPFPSQNILRIQVDQGGIAPPLKVTVTDHPTEPFQFDRRNGQPAR